MYGLPQFEYYTMQVSGYIEIELRFTAIQAAHAIFAMY
jgi:hypothetical protein